MVNKAMGEINAIHDDGSNFVMRRWIIPAEEVLQILESMQGDPKATTSCHRQAS